MLKAPKFFIGKTIEHNGFTIEYNKNYIGEYPEDLAVAMKEIEKATINPNHPTRIFKASIIEDNIDLDNLPYKCGAGDSKIWFDLRELGFTIQHKGGMVREFEDATSALCSGWAYRISPDCTQTLENIRKGN